MKEKIMEYTFKRVENISQEPVLIRYPQKYYDILERDDNPEERKEYRFPKAEYFSPFRCFKDVFIDDKEIQSNPIYDNVFLWTTYDVNGNVIQNPSGVLSRDELVVFEPDI
ncbi:hypothetical protein RyT2_10990 [Pseudolactococcus yaeyamensis]